ncbi:MAG: FeoA family protein [Leptolyngbyaceae bacterium]|nr:FeoA family protein [Leptolyngbyaceae bacterium]
MNSENRHRSTGGRGDWRFTYVGGNFGGHYGATEHAAEPRSRSASDSASWIRLSHAAVGETLEVVSHYAGVEFASNLAKLGVSIGSVIKVVSRTPSGSTLVCIDGRQLGFGWSAADQIYVAAVSNSHVSSSVSSDRDTNPQC